MKLIRDVKMTDGEIISVYGNYGEGINSIKEDNIILVSSDKSKKARFRTSIGMNRIELYISDEVCRKLINEEPLYLDDLKII